MHHVIDITRGANYLGELSPEAAKIVDVFSTAGSDSINIENTDLALLRNEHGLAEYDIALPEPMPSIRERSIPVEGREVRVRIYTPHVETSEPLPLFVYAHGGCWAFCSLDSHDHICHYLSHKARCVVVSVDYALAPEHPFPEGLNDYFGAVSWCYENALSIGVDSRRIAVGGDSAGGNLAAVVSQKLAVEGKISLCLQVLIYPISEVPASTSVSLEKYAEGYFFTKETLDWAGSRYLSAYDDVPQHDSLISPIAGELSKSLAPAVFVIAECDILSDQGLAYAEKLKYADVAVQCYYYRGMPHAFVAMAGELELGKQALNDCAEYLKLSFQQRVGSEF